MKRHNQISQLVVSLQNFSRNEHNLNGLSSPACFDVLACQIIDSIRRIRYVETLALRTDYMTPLRKEPNSDVFDPLRAACLHLRENNYDEACWLVFLATHFGKSNKTGWILCRDIYSGLGTQTWTWDTITDDFAAFEQWFASVSDELTANSSLRQYGNHRKYETKNITLVVQYLRFFALISDSLVPHTVMRLGLQKPGVFHLHPKLYSNFCIQG
jgi:hypothetical protein